MFPLMENPFIQHELNIEWNLTSWSESLNILNKSLRISIGTYLLKPDDTTGIISCFSYNISTQVKFSTRESTRSGITAYLMFVD